MFTARRKSPRHNGWRHAWIEGDSIAVQCGLSEAKDQLTDLKEDVNFANQMATSAEIERTKAAAEYARSQEAERERIRKLKGGLDFS